MGYRNSARDGAERELHGREDRALRIVVGIALLLTGFGFAILPLQPEALSGNNEAPLRLRTETRWSPPRLPSPKSQTVPTRAAVPCQIQRHGGQPTSLLPHCRRRPDFRLGQRAQVNGRLTYPSSGSAPVL